MTNANTPGRRRFSLGAALERLREWVLPVAKSLAEQGGDPLLHPLDVAAIVDPDRPVRFRLEEVRGSLPEIPRPSEEELAAIVDPDRPVRFRLEEVRSTLPEIPRPSGEELAGIVERAAIATWSTWVAGTAEPGWGELPERGRERVRAAVRVGLVAAGLIQEPEGPLSRLGPRP
jgi:hypothetical protein